MKIKFLVDYIGRETAMQNYKAGAELELDHQPAIELIKAGIAEESKPRKVKEVTNDTDK